MQRCGLPIQICSSEPAASPLPEAFRRGGAIRALVMDQVEFYKGGQHIWLLHFLVAGFELMLQRPGSSFCPGVLKEILRFYDLPEKISIRLRNITRYSGFKESSSLAQVTPRATVRVQLPELLPFDTAWWLAHGPNCIELSPVSFTPLATNIPPFPKCPAVSRRNFHGRVVLVDTASKPISKSLVWLRSAYESRPLLLLAVVTTSD